MQATTVSTYNQSVLHAHQRAIDALLKLLDSATDPDAVTRIVALIARFRPVKDPATQPSQRPPRPPASSSQHDDVANQTRTGCAVSSHHAPHHERGDPSFNPDLRSGGAAPRFAPLPGSRPGPQATSAGQHQPAEGG